MEKILLLNILYCGHFYFQICPGSNKYISGHHFIITPAFGPLTGVNRINTRKTCTIKRKYLKLYILDSSLNHITALIKEPVINRAHRQNDTSNGRKNCVDYNGTC